LKKRQSQLEQIVAERTTEIRAAKQQLEVQNQMLGEQAEELKELDKLKSQFFANISHELRTPLSLMLGPLSSALADKSISNRSFTLLKLAQNNGNKLLQMVNDILALTKFEKDQLELKEEEIDLYTFTRRIMAQFEYEASQKQIQFLFSFQPSKSLTLLLDGKKLEVVIRNLLANALKYSLPQGRIELKVNHQAEALEIRVSDSGIGISEADLPHIFDRFFQAKESSQGGTGIGLALSQAYVEIMGGQISVRSQKNQGSTFSVLLPYREVISSHQPLQEDDTSFTPDPSAFSLLETQAEASSKIPILVVDDNIEVQTYLQVILGDSYAIHKAFHGKEALEILNKNPSGHFQLIISDLMMPVMDGFELLDQLKTHETWHHIPVIMLTAKADQGVKLKALRVGVDDFLAKPFEEEELKVRIENLLKNAQQRVASFAEENEDISKETNDAEKTQAHLSRQELTWLAEVEQLVTDHVEAFDFNAQALADLLSISRVQLYRKLKKCTGLSPTEYLQAVRFSKARHLLEAAEVNSVKAAAYSVGIRHLGKFSGEFNKRFGRLPPQYLN